MTNLIINNTDKNDNINNIFLSYYDDEFDFTTQYSPSIINHINIDKKINHIKSKCSQLNDPLRKNILTNKIFDNPTVDITFDNEMDENKDNDENIHHQSFDHEELRKNNLTNKIINNDVNVNISNPIIDFTFDNEIDELDENIYHQSFDYDDNNTILNNLSDFNPIITSSMCSFNTMDISNVETLNVQEQNNIINTLNTEEEDYTHMKSNEYREINTHEKITLNNCI